MKKLVLRVILTFGMLLFCHRGVLAAKGLFNQRVEELIEFANNVIGEGNFKWGAYILSRIHGVLKEKRYSKLAARVQAKLNDVVAEKQGLIEMSKSIMSSSMLHHHVPDKQMVKLFYRLTLISHNDGDIKFAKSMANKTVSWLVLHHSQANRRSQRRFRKLLSSAELDGLLQILMDHRMYNAVCIIGRFLRKKKVDYKAFFRRPGVKRNLVLAQEATGDLKGGKLHRKLTKLVQACKNKQASGHSCDKVTAPLASFVRNFTTAPALIETRTCSENETTHSVSEALKLPKEKFWEMYTNVGRPAVVRGVVTIDQKVVEQFLLEHKYSMVSVSKSSDLVTRQWVEDCRTIACEELDKVGGLFFQQRAPLSAYQLNYSEIHAKKESHGDEPYLFGPLPEADISFTDISNLVREYFPPEHFSQYRDGRKARQLYSIGPSKSGTFFHSHGAAVNFLFEGMKKWYFMPPLSYVGSAYAPSMEWWLENVRANLPIQPIVLVQQPGDMVYIPPLWKHATVNLATPTCSTVYNFGEHNHPGYF
jgi:hypothetical protein